MIYGLAASQLGDNYGAMDSVEDPNTTVAAYLELEFGYTYAFRCGADREQEHASAIAIDVCCPAACCRSCQVRGCQVDVFATGGRSRIMAAIWTSLPGGGGWGGGQRGAHAGLLSPWLPALMQVVVPADRGGLRGVQRHHQRAVSEVCVLPAALRIWVLGSPWRDRALHPGAAGPGRNGPWWHSSEGCAASSSRRRPQCVLWRPRVQGSLPSSACKASRRAEQTWHLGAGMCLARAIGVHSTAVVNTAGMMPAGDNDRKPPQPAAHSCLAYARGLDKACSGPVWLICFATGRPCNWAVCQLPSRRRGTELASSPLCKLVTPCRQTVRRVSLRPAALVV
jgi:hypothetical protein